MTDFTSIVFEVLIGSTWTDVSDDVLADPAPQCTRGIPSTSPIARMGGPGTLTFALNNTASNSAGLVGYYSPEHANCRSGWGLGLKIRLKFTYDTWTRVKWAGYVDRLEFNMITNTLGTVVVSCIDWLGIAARHKLNVLSPIANATVEQAVRYIIGNVPIPPMTLDAINLWW